MATIDDAKSVAKELKLWAQAELDRLNKELTFLDTIVLRENKYTEMDDLVTQAKGSNP